MFTLEEMTLGIQIPKLMQSISSCKVQC